MVFPGLKQWAKFRLKEGPPYSISCGLNWSLLQGVTLALSRATGNILWQIVGMIWTCWTLSVAWTPFNWQILYQHTERRGLEVVAGLLMSMLLGLDITLHLQRPDLYPWGTSVKGGIVASRKLNILPLTAKARTCASCSRPLKSQVQFVSWHILATVFFKVWLIFNFSSGLWPLGCM